MENDYLIVEGDASSDETSEHWTVQFSLSTLLSLS